LDLFNQFCHIVNRVDWRGQFDVFCQFLIGSFDDSTSFLGDLLLAARRNFTSVGGFWYVDATEMKNFET
jgi:hypothetical protein